MIKFCSLTPNFPKIGYVVMVFGMKEGRTIMLLPLNPLFRSLKEASDYTKKFVTHIKNHPKVKNINIPEVALLLPVVLEKLVPFKKSYWSKPTAHYGSDLRDKLFLSVPDNLSSTSLFVSPNLYDTKKRRWQFYAALPLVDTNEEKLASIFSRYDIPVDPKAKHGAIYRFTEELKFHWKTAKTEPIDLSSKKSGKYIN